MLYKCFIYLSLDRFLPIIRHPFMVSFGKALDMADISAEEVTGRSGESKSFILSMTMVD